MSGTRPSWEPGARFWLTDGQYRPNGAGSDWHYIWRGWIEDIGKWLLCRAFGHLPITDQCGKPEHDYCACCLRATPRQAA